MRNQITTMKCNKCIHFYRMMTGENGYGYNPSPCCHLYEDKGERPSVLTQECFEAKRPIKKDKNKVVPT